MRVWTARSGIVVEVSLEFPYSMVNNHWASMPDLGSTGIVRAIFFNPHTDGAWPGSRVVNGQLVADAYGDRLSQMTALIFLSDGYEGGRTLFHTGPTSIIPVHTPKGAILCFPHGMHPQHCVHAGEVVTAGQKYIIRTDVLYG